MPVRTSLPGTTSGSVISSSKNTHAEYGSSSGKIDAGATLASIFQFRGAACGKV
ncbi:hypothetical protein [Teredinibacter turnerae]|uniref:hypothetical protein n=1 Tax=Teredinibacter turnerae TaxID=2426 RepID=UPI0012BD820D|nr:hypothetical protein [Teredinibacter turnerae]